MKKAILIFFLCLPTVQMFAQNGVMINYGLGGKDDSAILELKSADQGFLAPKIALTGTTATAPIYNNAPAVGLIVYNTATVSDVIPGYYYWDGAKWTRLLNGASAPPTGSGTQNYVTKWNNAAGTTLGNSQIFDNGTNVSIGTTSIPSRLNVNGNAVIGTGLVSRSGIGLTVSTNSAATYASNTDIGDGARMLSIVNENATANSMAALSMRTNPSGGVNNQMLDMKLVNPNDGTSKLHFSFGPNGSFNDRFTFTSAGNLGIGTTTPSGKLEVNQDNSVDAVSGSNVGSIHLTHPTSGIGGVSAITFKSTVNWPSDGGYLAFYDDNNSYNYWGDSNENSALVLGTTNDGQNASSDVVVLKSQAAVIADAPSFLVPSGNVGIGTTGPSGNLQIRGSSAFDATTALNITNGSADYGRTQLRLTGRIQAGNDGWAMNGRTNILFAANASASGAGLGAIGTDKFAIQYQMLDDKLGVLSSTLGASPVMVFQQNGNVGIGTTAPAAPLHIAGNNTSDSPNGAIEMSRYWNTAADTRASSIFHYVNSTTAKDNLAFAVSGDGGSYNNPNQLSQIKMVIQATGNVGIGTTAPAYRLDLASGTFGFGSANVRTETRDNAGLQGNAGAQSGMFETSVPTNYYAGASSWQHMLDVRHSNSGNNYAMQFAGSFYDQNLWFRKTNNNPAQAWSRILTTTDIPGGTLPTGSLGQTLYHNGTNWVAGSNLSNDGATINLGTFSTTDIDEWPKVTWLRNTGAGWDEGLIKGSSSHGAWGRAGFGIHMMDTKHFGFFSTGWIPLFDIEGGTGRAYHKGSVGIGATNPLDNLFIAGTNNNGTDVLNNDGNDRPGLSIRGDYPEINLITSQGTNAQHGATLRFVAYDNTTRDTWKHWVVGVPGADAYFLDFGYRANATNPHEGISGYAGATVMRMTNNGNVGIGNFGTYGTVGLTQPASTLHIMGKTNIHQSGAAGGQNRFEGIDAPTSANGRAQLVLSSAYSDLVIASSNANDNHGSTLTFATYNPADANDYRKFVINQGNWGNRKGYLDFGFADAGGRTNPHTNINGTDVVQTLDGINKRVGIGTMNPAAKLHVYNVYPFVGGTDGMLKIKSVTGPCCGTETVALQTTIDDRTDDYVISGYGGDSRHVLSLQPDGGFVGVGTNVAADKLHVQTGNIRLSQPAATNTGNIVYQSSQETNADWRLWNLDDFESGNDGWNAYQSITSGTTTTFSRNDPGIYGTSAFLNYYNLGNGGATVFKKGFAIPASESGWVKIKVTYHFIDTWDGEYAYIGVTNAVTTNPTILWNTTHGGANKPQYSYFGGGAADGFQTVEAVVKNNFGGTMWLVVGSGLNQASNDESFGIDDVEIWVK